jgi:hypothetical protein
MARRNRIESTSRVMKLKTKNEKHTELVHGILINADNEYQTYSSQVSPIARTLALTAIAVIWLFAGAKTGTNKSPFAILHSLESARSLDVALALALSVLLVDLLQYVWGSLAWGIYRWSLDQILINDSFDQDDLSARARLGWALARLFHVTRYLEYRVSGNTGSDSSRSWPRRRSDLRNQLGKVHVDKGLTSLTTALSTPWSPVIINRIVTVFFLCKICLLIVCYVLLGRFLLF